MEKADDVLSGLRLIEEKKLVQKFLKEVNKDAGLAIYGFDDIKKALLNSSVDTILITDNIGLTYLKSICNHCGKEEVRQVGRDKYTEVKQEMTSACSKCSSPDKELQEKDIIEYLADLSVDSGANVEVISSKTEEGRMLDSFSGIAAILRYKVRS